MFFLRRQPRPIRTRNKRSTRLPSRPILEALEDRIVPAGPPINVFQLADGTGPGSLRTAITQANANTNGIQTINLTQQGTYNLTLPGPGGATGGPLLIDNTGNANIPNDPSIIVIKGQGAGKTIINANFQYGAFEIGATNGTTVVFQDLTIKNGKATPNDFFASNPTSLTVDGKTQNLSAAGGGIDNVGGTVMLSNVNVSTCSASATASGQGAAGGGIFSSGGSLTLNTVVLNKDTVKGGTGLPATAPVIKNGRVIQQGAPGTDGGFAVGGGLAEIDTPIVTTDVIFDPIDSTTFPPAAPLPTNFDPSSLFNNVPLLTVTNNKVQGGTGGKGGPSGGNSQAGSTVSQHGGTGGTGQGGGLWLSASSVGISANIAASTIAKNQALGGNGGVAPTTAGKSDTGADGGAGGTAGGGGLYVNGGTALTISTSTLSGNIAHGGQGANGSNGNDGSRTVPPYLSHASGGNGGDGGDAAGGALDYDNSGDGSLLMFNDTVANNNDGAGGGGNGGKGTPGGTNGGGGNGANAKGGGIAITTDGSAVQLTNVTIAFNGTQGGSPGNIGTATKSVGNPAPPTAGSSQGGGLYTTGGSPTINNTIISQDLVSGTGIVSGTDVQGYNNVNIHNLIGGTPLLGTLSSNGGPTQTISLAPASPAVGAGDNSTAVIDLIGDIDQRGVFRGTVIDIGAYQETVVPPPPPASFTFTISAVGPIAANTLPIIEHVTATVTQNGSAVSGGSVAFTLATPQGVTEAAAVASQPTQAGGNTFAVDLPIKSNAPPGVYTVTAVYTTSTRKVLATSPGKTSLSINQAPVNITSISAIPGTFSNTTSQAVTVTATLLTPNSGTVHAGPVTEGTVVFTITGPDGKTYTEPLGVQVKNGTAIDNITLPAGVTPGSYGVQLAYNDSTQFFLSQTAGQSNTFNVTAAAGIEISGSVRPSAIVASNTTSTPVLVSADVFSGNTPVASGSVTFALVGPSGTIVDDTQTPIALNISGHAQDTLQVPAGTPSGSYNLRVIYTDPSGRPTTQTFSGALAVSTLPTTVSVSGASVVFSSAAQNISVSAQVSSTSGTVNSGVVTFTLMQGATPVLFGGSPVQVTAPVSNNTTGAVQMTLPPGLAAGSYTIQGVYSDPLGNFASGSGTGTLFVTVPTPPPPPPPPPPVSPPPPPAAPVAIPFLQAALALFFDGQEKILFGDSPAIEQDIANNTPFAQPFSNLLVLAGEIAAFNSITGGG